ELRLLRHLERDARLGERPLRADDPLRDRRLRDEERAGDLLGRQAAEEAQRERHARLEREDRVARHEDEAQEIVAEVLVERALELRRDGLGLLAGVEIAADLGVLALEHLVPPEGVER